MRDLLPNDGARRWRALAVVSMFAVVLVVGTAVALGGSGSGDDPEDQAARDVARETFCAAIGGDYAGHLDLAGGEGWGDGSSRDLRRTLATFSYPEAFVLGAPASLRELAGRVRDQVLVSSPAQRDPARALNDFETLLAQSSGQNACPTG